jgi:serine/threonine protein kinase
MHPSTAAHKSPERAPAPRETDPLEGSPYRLLGVLGAGGMGEVFEAKHRALGHSVVVKVLRAQLATRPDMCDRMRVEGQALARIRHPHLVMVTDFGETRSGRPYIVMERLAGRSLREEMRARSVLPVAEAIEIARQTLLGLAAVHEAGIVHRDIKPDNVFLCATEDGRPFVKVLDFGVAKIVQAGRDPRTPDPLAAPTDEGVSLGTPRYFSPEQARGLRDLDARCDVYAVGLLLYGMVVGRGPFDHHTQLRDLFRAHALEEPRPPSAGASQRLPAELDRIVMCALTKAREERFPDATRFALELAQLLLSLGPEGTRLGGPSPMLIGAPDGRWAAGATTTPFTPVLGPEDPTATARPVLAGERNGLRSTSRKLSDEPVMLDGLAERIRENPPEHVRQRLSRPENSDRTAIDTATAVSPLGRPSQPGDTVQMQPSFTRPPPVQPIPAPRAGVPETVQIGVPGASQPMPPPRAGVPETVQIGVPGASQPMPPPRAGVPETVPIGVPQASQPMPPPRAGVPGTVQMFQLARSSFIPPLPSLRGSPAPAAWSAPLVVAAVLLIAAAALLIALVLS